DRLPREMIYPSGQSIVVGNRSDGLASRQHAVGGVEEAHEESFIALDKSVPHYTHHHALVRRPGSEGHNTVGGGIITPSESSSVGSRVIDGNRLGAWNVQRNGKEQVRSPHVAFHDSGVSNRNRRWDHRC